MPTSTQIYDYLYHKWQILLTNCSTTNHQIAQTYWEQLVSAYTTSDRYYHNLTHLYELGRWFDKYQSKLNSWKSMYCAMFYHDIIYQTSRTDNEEQSALVATKQLNEIGIEPDIIKLSVTLIRATQGHEALPNYTDTHYFLDADLAILGADWQRYKQYTQQIRAEYYLFSDALYKAGRKKVLQKFLDRKNLYFTSEFRQLLETKARKNMKREMVLLS